MPVDARLSSLAAWVRVLGCAAFDLPRPVGMARALDLVGLPLEGRHHRGDDDADARALIVRAIEAL